MQPHTLQSLLSETRRRRPHIILFHPSTYCQQPRHGQLLNQVLLKRIAGCSCDRPEAARLFSLVCPELCLKTTKSYYQSVNFHFSAAHQPRAPPEPFRVLTAHQCWALACTNYTYILHQPSTLSCTVTVNDYWGGGLARSWRTLLYSTLLNSTAAAAAAALPAKQPTQLTHRQRDSSVVFAINGTAYNF